MAISHDAGYKFILNQWFQAKNGGMMNVMQIKSARDEAAAKILEIVRGLEHSTGMVATSLDVEYDFDEACRSTGATSVSIELQL